MADIGKQSWWNFGIGACYYIFKAGPLMSPRRQTWGCSRRACNQTASKVGALTSDHVTLHSTVDPPDVSGISWSPLFLVIINAIFSPNELKIASIKTSVHFNGVTASLSTSRVHTWESCWPPIARFSDKSMELISSVSTCCNMATTWHQCNRCELQWTENASTGMRQRSGLSNANGIKATLLLSESCLVHLKDMFEVSTPWHLLLYCRPLDLAWMEEDYRIRIIVPLVSIRTNHKD